jgi:hypothetical protein
MFGPSSKLVEELRLVHCSKEEPSSSVIGAVAFWVMALWEIFLAKDFGAVRRNRLRGSGTGFVERASWPRGMEISASDLGAAKTRACSGSRPSEAGFRALVLEEAVSP